MTKAEIKDRLDAISERMDLDVLFKDYGITNLLRDLNVNDWLAFDADEFNRIVWHSTANLIGIKIATRKHKTLSCYIVLRYA